MSRTYRTIMEPSAPEGHYPARHADGTVVTRTVTANADGTWTITWDEETA